MEKLRHLEYCQDHLKKMGNKEENVRLEKERVKKELFKVKKNQQKFEAESRLKEMKDKRIKAEMGIHYLKAAQDTRLSNANWKINEQTSAYEHYKQSNSHFDANKKLYSDQLNRKRDRQDKIAQLAMSPDQKYPTYSMDTINKDKKQDKLIDKQAEKKLKEEDVKVKIKQELHMKNMYDVRKSNIELQI